MLQTNLAAWVGKTETQTGILDEAAASMLYATLDTSDSSAPMQGYQMPPLWHWSAFTPKAPMDLLNSDGHPKLGDFMPPIKLARRMWAGGSLTFHTPLHVGARLKRDSGIVAITEKEGAAGPMVFVTLRHEISQGGARAVSETQDIVYLNIPDRFSAPKAKPVPERFEFMSRADTSEARLFRYSAATFNAHRIHYDLPYASQVEKYPGLVVHGPLQATLLMQAAMAHTGSKPATFSFRGIHPMFHFDDMHLFGSATDDGMDLCTGIPGAHQGMQAKITWRNDG